MLKGKRRLSSRVMAMFLAVLMVLQNIPVTAYADTIFSDEVSLQDALAYTVTFQDAAGNTVDTVTVSEGEAVTEQSVPAAPAREGYQFSSWLNGDSPVEFPFTPTGDATLTAGYDKTWTVTWTVDGETVSAGEYRENTAIGKLPLAPEKKNASFLGWFNGENQVTEATEINGDMTAAARYADDLMVQFKLDDESEDYAEKRFVAAGAAVGALPEAPFKSGYRFVGWVS